LERLLAKQIHDGLSPEQFETLVFVLLDKMGFLDVQKRGGSGDAGIDLKATWNQTEVPGLEIDLDFVIQAKRFDPDRSLNPKVVRELRGSLISGQWGLLITTARVTAQTRQDGLRDSSRVVSIIDGSQLVYLCQKYEVAFRKNYQFDSSFLNPHAEESVPRPETTSEAPSDLTALLTDSIGEKFERLGRTPIYKSINKTVIARWSQRYPRKGQNYWYGLTARDVASVSENGIAYFAYVCDGRGTVLLPVEIVMSKIQDNSLGRTPSEGSLRHYHISFSESGGDLSWLFREGKSESIKSYFHPVRPESK
jgi:Restriction endonuclease